MDLPRLEPEYTRQELLDLCAKMDAAVQRTYPLLVACGVHPLVEFNGLMHEYVVLCRALADKGVQFPFASVHGSVSVEAEDHSVAYLSEKLACIFAPFLRGNPRAKDILVRALTEAES